MPAPREAKCPDCDQTVQVLFYAVLEPHRWPESEHWCRGGWTLLKDIMEGL